MAHSHDGGLGHSHDDPFNGHGHSHDILDGPGSYVNREMPLIEGRDWKDRAFTIGIGGYVTFTFLPTQAPFSPLQRYIDLYLYLHKQTFILIWRPI